MHGYSNSGWDTDRKPKPNGWFAHFNLESPNRMWQQRGGIYIYCIQNILYLRTSRSCINWVFFIYIYFDRKASKQDNYMNAITPYNKTLFLRHYDTIVALSFLCGLAPVPVKGIVSWDWGGLLMFLLDIYEVPVTPQNIYFSFNVVFINKT
jgi:hypothetical protein